MDAQIEYPRVLILGQNFDLVTGGGITLGNLFHGWPAERLAVAGTERCEMVPRPCGHEYLLGQAERRWIRPLRLARLFGTPQNGPHGPTAALLPQEQRSSPTGTRYTRLRPLAKAVFHGMSRSLGSETYLRPLALSKELLSWSDSFQPSLIYSGLGSLDMIRLTLELARALRSPIAIHVMDDWPEVIYRHGLLRQQLRTRTDRELRAIIDLATARLAISEAMANEYADRYGHDWAVFHNPVDLKRWSKTRRTSWALADGFRMVYSGRIGPGTESSLLDVSRAVALLRRQGRNIHLDIHSWDFKNAVDHRFAGFDGVDVHGAVAESEMPVVLAQADALVLPFDFYGEAAALFRLSFPTKATGYMATGTPVLVYAPPLMRWPWTRRVAGGDTLSAPRALALWPRPSLGSWMMKNCGESLDAEP